MDEETLAQMMAAHAEDAVDHARLRLHVNLDYSEESIRAVERPLDRLRRKFPRGISRLFKRPPSQEVVATVSKMYGGYVGEVFRHHHGGRWRLQDHVPGVDGPVIALNVPDGDTFFPPSKVYKRLMNGEEDSVWFYYQVLTHRATGPASE